MRQTYRVLAVGMLVTAVGRGLYIPASVVYFATQLQLTPNQVGFALSCAGAGALISAMPLGTVVDRASSPRTVAIAYGLLHSAAMAALLVSSSFPIFVAVITLLGVAERGSSVARQALVALLFSPEQRVLTQARLRTVANVGTSAGALVAALAMATDLPGIYGWLITGNAVALLTLAGLLLLLPPGRSLAEVPASPAWRSVVRDRPFLTLALLNGVLSLHSAILRVGLPLWVTIQVGGPVWLVPILYGINTVLTVLLQVRAAGRAETPDLAVAALRRSGLFTAGACLLMLSTGFIPESLAVVVLVVGVVALTAGEVHQSAGGWGLAYGLGRSRAEGTYLGAFSMGTSLQELAGPILVTTVLVGFPVAGPIAIAGALVATGFAISVLFLRWYSVPVARLVNV
jgi:MFS family permease